MTLTLLPLGTGDAFSATRHSCASALIHESAAGRAVLVIDCPHPLRKMLREASAISGIPLDVPDLSACVLTHLHADHASGVEGYLWYSLFVVGSVGTLAVHDDVRQRLWEGHLAGGMETLRSEDGGVQRLTLDAVARCVRLDDHAPTSIGPFTVELRRTLHHIPTFAVRVRVGGASVAFSADTAWDPSLVAWLLEADLAVHETGHGGGGHTPLDRLAALPAEDRARMRLTHFADDLDVSSLPITHLEAGRPVVITPRRR
ncbi:MAG: ribonuclease Z [Deltaproteobacteria bacterium]|nr:ribonuclease Z [Deltaproteobacteria bacterium]